MNFKVSGHVLIACVKGDVDHHTAARLRNQVDGTMKEHGCRDIVLDFSDVDFMDSSGIGVVLGRYKKLVKKGGRVYVAGCSNHMEKILDMAGVFSVAGKAADSEEALSLMDGQEQIRMEV